MIEPALCETSLMTFYEAIIIIYKNRIQNKYNRLFLLVILGLGFNRPVDKPILFWCK